MVVPDRSDLCLCWVRMTLSHTEVSATGHLRSHAARQAYVLCQNGTVVVASQRANMS